MEFVAIKEEEIDLYEREDEELMSHEFDTTMTQEEFTYTTGASTSMTSLPLVPKIEVEEHNIMEQNEEQEQQHDVLLPFSLSNHFMEASDNQSEHESFRIPPINMQPQNNDEISEGKSVSKCYHCLKYFPHSDALVRHCKIHHFCKYCNKPFNNYDEFYLHNFEIHTGNANCDLCTKEFSSLQDRYMHIGNHTYVKGYKYTDKDKYIPTISEISYEPSQMISCELCKNQLSVNEKHICPKLVCMVCDLKFESIENVCQHIKDKHVYKSKACKHCKSKLEEIDYVSHFELCSRLKEYRRDCISKKKVFKIDKNMIACKYCKGIYYKGSIEKHIEQNHKCLMCSQIFPNTELLVKHMLTLSIKHNNVRKIKKCQFCTTKYLFTTKKSFLKHLKNIHVPNCHNHISCPRCGDLIYDSSVSKKVHYNVCINIQIAKKNTVNNDSMVIG